MITALYILGYLIIGTICAMCAYFLCTYKDMPSDETGAAMAITWLAWPFVIIFYIAFICSGALLYGLSELSEWIVEKLDSKFKKH